MLAVSYMSTDFTLYMHMMHFGGIQQLACRAISAFVKLLVLQTYSSSGLRLRYLFGRSLFHDLPNLLLITKCCDQQFCLGVSVCLYVSMHVCLIDCMPVSPWAHLRNHTTKHHQIVDAWWLWPWLDRSFLAVLWLVLPVLWITSCLHIMTGIGGDKKAYAQNNSPGAASGRSLMIIIALYK